MKKFRGGEYLPDHKVRGFPALMPSVGQINSQGILPGGKEEREIIRRTCTAGFQNESLLCATDDAVSSSFLQKYGRAIVTLSHAPAPRNPRSQRGVQATKLSVCNRLEAPRQDYRRGLRERDRKNAGGNEPASVMNFTHDHEHAPIYEEYLNPAELAPPTVFFLVKETSPTTNQPIKTKQETFKRNPHGRDENAVFRHLERRRCLAPPVHRDLALSTLRHRRRCRRRLALLALGGKLPLADHGSLGALALSHYYLDRLHGTLHLVELHADSIPVQEWSSKKAGVVS